MFDESIKFKYPWRPYQAKILEEVNGLIKDKKIVILIHTGRDMFNLASFLSDIGEKTFVQCFEEICSVLDLVEELKLNEKLGL